MLLLKTLSLIISAEFLRPQKVTFMVSGNQDPAISAGILLFAYVFIATEKIPKVTIIKTV